MTMTQTEPTPNYLGWADPDPKKPDARKVDEARARFVEKFGYEPTEIVLKAPGLWWLGPVAKEG